MALILVLLYLKTFAVIIYFRYHIAYMLAAVDKGGAYNL